MLKLILQQQAKNRGFDSAFAELLRGADDVRTYFLTLKDYFYLPDLKKPKLT